jgi:hypothetical protein
MIFNIPVAGKLEVMCTFLGAPGETLTFKQNGTTVYTVTENTATEIKQGIYEVTGSISGYTKTITIKKAGAYNAYPAGAVYWYGREVYAMSAVVQYSESGMSASKDKNSIYVQARYPNGGSYKSRYAYACTSAKVDTSGYSTIKFKAYPSWFTGERTRRVQLGYSSSQGYSYAGHTFTSAGSTSVYSVTSPKSSVYLGIGAYTASEDYKSVHTAAATLYAIWME